MKMPKLENNSLPCLSPDYVPYQTLIQCEWADLHHSRIQEWSSLGVVTGAHLAFTQMPKALNEINIPIDPTTAGIIASIFGFSFAVVGMLVTCHHRHIMVEKLGWIFQAEEKMGLIKSETNAAGIIPKKARMKRERIRWKELEFPKLLSVSGLIFLFYLMFILFDVAYFFLCLASH